MALGTEWEALYCRGREDLVPRKSRHCGETRDRWFTLSAQANFSSQIVKFELDIRISLHYNAIQGRHCMERQLTMRLPADLATKLERSAKRLKRKRSEVVREALEQYLDTQPDVRPIERVRDLLGSVASGRPDLGQRHRDYLTRRLRRGR